MTKSGQQLLEDLTNALIRHAKRGSEDGKSCWAEETEVFCWLIGHAISQYPLEMRDEYLKTVCDNAKIIALSLGGSVGTLEQIQQELSSNLGDKD